MRHALIVIALCTGAPYAAAVECPAERFTVQGHTYSRGLIDALNGTPKDCDTHEEPAWLAQMNDVPPSAAASKASPPGLAYCRQLVQTKDPQNEAQRHDCVYWYGHSIEVK